MTRTTQQPSPCSSGSARSAATSGGKSDDEQDDADEPDDLGADDAAETQLVNELRRTVLSLTPAGFENLCKQLLTELGLVQLRTVGRPRDRR